MQSVLKEQSVGYVPSAYFFQEEQIVLFMAKLYNNINVHIIIGNIKRKVLEKRTTINNLQVLPNFPCLLIWVHYTVQ